MKKISRIVCLGAFLTLTLTASRGYCGGGGQIVIETGWITYWSQALCFSKKPQDYCYNESKACRDEFEKGLTDLLNKTCPIQSGDWWCDPDPNKDLTKILTYVDNFKATETFLHTLKTCNPLPPASCGDGILNGNDECDDGNNKDGDGCSGKCIIEIPADIDASCYQNLHNGNCAQKKQACDQIQGDKNCPEQLNQCLQDALNTCKKSNMVPAVQSTSSSSVPPSPPLSSNTTSCSLAPFMDRPNLPFSAVFLAGLVPMAWIRVKSVKKLFQILKGNFL